jgi:ribonuclease Z
MNAQLWFIGTGSAEPVKDRANTSILVKDCDSGALLLLDCSGNPCHAIYRSGNMPERLRDVILTHAHTDHVYALPSLIHGLWLHRSFDKSKALRVYGTQATLDVARALVGTLALESKRDPVRVEWCLINPQSDVELMSFGDLQVYAFSVLHAGISAVGIELRGPSGDRVLYSGDAQADDRVRARLTRSTHILIHDVGGGISKNVGHAGAREVAALIDGSNIAKVYLVHLPEMSADDLAYMKSIVAGKTSRSVIIPNDGDSICFSI